MARYFVTQAGPYDYPPFSRGGIYRVWDEQKSEPLREIHWYESRGAPLVGDDRTLSEAEARGQAYSAVSALNGPGAAADAYRRCK